jgi:drug/metabolite transporter (DMT)-like permease
MMQIGGNVAFQYALSIGGLALTVPLCFSTLILAGAFGGRMILGETIPRRTLAAMMLLIVAVFILQQGADEAAETLRPDRSAWTVFASVVAACISGASFGAGGVAIRHSVAGRGTIAATIAPISTAGVIACTVIAVQQLGIDGLLRISVRDQASMLFAGMFNAIGFFAVAAAMARIPLVRVNLINASQAALCALAGIAWFGEPATIWVGLGTGLTVLSLAILGTGDRGAISEPPVVLDAEPMALMATDLGRNGAPETPSIAPTLGFAESRSDTIA